MKKLFASLLLLVGLSANAQTYSHTLTGTSDIYELLTTGKGVVEQVTFVNASASDATIAIIDAPATNLTYSIGQFTNRTDNVWGATGIVTFTNFNGLVQSVTNYGMFKTNVVVATQNRNYPVRWIYLCPANSSITVNPGVEYYRGVNFTNTGISAGSFSIQVRGL